MFRERVVKLNSQITGLISSVYNEKEFFTFLTSSVSGFTFTVFQAVYAALTETVVSVGNNSPAMQLIIMKPIPD